MKAVLLDESGGYAYESAATLPLSNPRPTWSEQLPEEWWTACRKATLDLRNQGAPLENVTSVSLSGQMHGATLLDSKGDVLRPCILWNDGRCGQAFPQSRPCQ